MKPELLKLAGSAAAEIGLLLPMPLFLLIVYLTKRIKEWVEIFREEKQLF